MPPSETKGSNFFRIWKIFTEYIVLEESLRTELRWVREEIFVVKNGTS
jgi:hypothetical protein